MSQTSSELIGRAAILAQQAARHRTTPCRGWMTMLLGWLERSTQRQALRELAERNDYLLSDIGLTRDQALGEAAKSFWS